MTFSIKTLVRTGLRETNQNITPKVKKKGKKSDLLIDVSIEKIVHRASSTPQDSCAESKECQHFYVWELRFVRC